MLSVLKSMARISAMVAAFSILVMCAACRAKQQLYTQSSQLTDNFKLQFIRSCSPIGVHPPSLRDVSPSTLPLLGSCIDGAPCTPGAAVTQSVASLMPGDTLTIIGSRKSAVQMATSAATSPARSATRELASTSYTGYRPLLLLFILSFVLNLLFVWILSKLGGKN